MKIYSIFYEFDDKDISFLNFFNLFSSIMTRIPCSIVSVKGGVARK